MKLYSLPKKTEAFIFDIDGTLYTSPEYVREQVDTQIRHFAKIRGMTNDEARTAVNQYRNAWSRAHGGKQISLGNAFLHFGISIETSIQWRNELLEPEKFLKPDPKLKNSLEQLKKKFSLICVTNNPVAAARRTLKAVGIEQTIPLIIGLDTLGKSKPDRELLELAAQTAGAQFSQCIAVGDRFDIDIALPLELGMGGILVDGAEDVCAIPALFS